MKVTFNQLFECSDFRYCKYLLTLSLGGWGFRQVVGIEMNASAVADAQLNAELNGISNCHFVCGKVLIGMYNGFSEPHSDLSRLVQQFSLWLQFVLQFEFVYKS